MKILHRSTTDQIAAGVCAGIGKTYDLDPTVVRLVLIFLTIATGILPLVITYAVAGLIVPKEDANESPKSKDSASA